LENKRRRFLAAGTAATVSVILPGCYQEPKKTSQPLPPQVSVNLAGAEFGMEQADFSNQNPGKLHQQYTFNSLTTVRYFTQRGVRTFRVPISWERIQPTLGQDLNSEYLSNLLLLLSWIKECQAEAIIDLHNYCRYRMEHNGQIVEALMGQSYDGDELLTVDHLCDVWIRLAKHLVDRPEVHAYGIMNEPHDLGGLDWNSASNRVVKAIRQVDPSRWITICGDSWASAARFPTVNGNKAWIEDPSDRIIYEAHAYFDADQSGKYLLNYEEELSRDPELAKRPLRVLEPFIQWCQANQVPGLIGEIGVPDADPGWLNLLATGCQAIRDANISVSCWAAGEWWKQYPLSVQPKDWNDPLRPQMETILATMTK